MVLTGFHFLRFPEDLIPHGNVTWSPWFLYILSIYSQSLASFWIDLSMYFFFLYHLSLVSLRLFM